MCFTLIWFSIDRGAHRDGGEDELRVMIIVKHMIPMILLLILLLLLLIIIIITIIIITIIVILLIMMPIIVIRNELGGRRSLISLCVL